MPVALKGPLCLLENGSLKLLSGELLNGRMTDLVFEHDAVTGAWRVAEWRLAVGARGRYGCTGIHAWSNRGAVQRDEFCLLGGGDDGTGVRDGFFRVYTR